MTITTESTATPDESTATEPEVDEFSVDEFADKLFGDLIAYMDTCAVAIGVELGWYEALASAGPMTSAQLAGETSSDERYAREWLEQQVVAGYLHVLDSEVPPAERRFSMSDSAAEVLTDRGSLAYMAPFAGFATTLGGNLAGLVEVYRNGGGFGWHQHGDGARCGQAEANRPMFLQQLAQEYLASIDDVHSRLTSGARVADVGCGLGWSSIGIARAYPDVTVDGYDIDGPSIDRANDYASEAGVADRVSFHAADVANLDAGGYDVVLALECVHDMADPVAVLAAMRSMVGADGVAIVMDERVGESFSAQADPWEHLLYGFSLLCCLPDGRNAQESVATGAVMRPDTLEGYARDAGFGGIEVLPIENDFFRFYRLVS